MIVKKWKKCIKKNIGNFLSIYNKLKIMAQKITLNELRRLVKQVMNENSEITKFAGSQSLKKYDYGNNTKIWSILRDYRPYDFGPYTEEEAKIKIEKLKKEDQQNRIWDKYYSIMTYNEMRDELPARERMETPKLMKNGNWDWPDTTPFNKGDLADY